MPLLPGKSEIGHNISEMEKAGHPHKQAVAAALHRAYDAHAAGTLLRTPDNRALFLKRSAKSRDHQGEWCCPGGSIESGETPEQAANRETQEETGYAPADLTQIDESSGFVTFGSEVQEFAPTLNEEHDEYRWAPMDAPPEPLHPGVAETLRKINANRSAVDEREVDSNGWFEIKNNPISKAGVFPYSEAAILKGGDRNKMINVLLPPEELGSEETIKSFRLLPWTDDHPDALLGKREDGLVPADEKGIRGVIGQDIHFDNDTLYANVKVFSETLAKKIAAGKRELSCGYRCDFVPQEGFYQGKSYQYVQRNVRGNHQASVDKGRRGPDIRVLDAAERFTFSLDMSEETAMAEKRKDEAEGTVDADTISMIGDSFNGLVSELEKKGYSKEYATKIAGKVAAEKGMTGHHDSIEVKTVADTETKTESEKEKEAKDRKAARDARDAKRVARDARRGMDSMSSEEEEAEDAAECTEDAEEEKEDEKDDSKDARDRKSARDRRHGARDARKSARDRAKDKAAKDAAKDAKKGMDAAEVSALVDQKVRDVAPVMRREAAAVHKLYQRLSPVIGAFDHDEMSVSDMSAYGLKKLGAPDASDPVTALDYFLAGRAQAPSAEVQARKSAQDSGELPAWFTAATAKSA